MARFVLVVPSRLTPTQAWRAVLDLGRHGEVIPLTRLSGDGLSAPGSLGLGSRFTARTALGPVGVDDVMEIESWSPPTSGPGRCRIRKHGRVVGGWVVLTVAPAPGGSIVCWSQEISVAGVSRVADALVGRVARAAYQATLVRLLDVDRAGS